MNHTFENVKQHMQTHRKPSAPTIRRVFAGIALLTAFAVSGTLHFTSLCANIGAASDLNTSAAQIVDNVSPTNITSYQVYVQNGDKTYTLETDGCKAGEAVYALGLSTGNSFALDPPAQTVLEPGDTVRVLPCSTTDRVVTEEIPFKTKTVRDNKLFVGQTQTVTAGKPGVREIVYRDRYVGNKRVSSVIVSTHVTEKPVNEVRHVGTRKLKAVSKTPISNLRLPDGFRLDENGTPASYQSYFDGVATAYYGGGITATGVPAAVGYVAVDPKVIPYGTKLWITSLDGEYVYGYAVAADTGGFAWGGWADVDLYMDTYDECVAFGKRDVRIYIL